MRPNRRWIPPAVLTALAAATTTAALARASAGPPAGSRTPNAVAAARTTAAGPSRGTAAAGRAGAPSPAGTGTTTRGTTARTAATSGGAQIAATTLGADLKITLRAYRVGAYDALVDVAAFRYARGAWRPAWHARVPGPWFYHPLTGRNGVCSLRVTNRPDAAATVDLSLLVSPSVGCSPVRHFTIR